jgi:hypothetical protein
MASCRYDNTNVLTVHETSTDLTNDAAVGRCLPFFISVICIASLINGAEKLAKGLFGVNLSKGFRGPKLTL